MSAESQAASLVGYGYTEVTELGQFQVGARVRHVGQQWSEAYANGTGVIERIFVRGERDIELIIKRDKPGFGPTDTHGYWANYHTVVVTP